MQFHEMMVQMMVSISQVVFMKTEVKVHQKADVIVIHSYMFHWTVTDA